MAIILYTFTDYIRRRRNDDYRRVSFLRIQGLSPLSRQPLSLSLSLSITPYEGHVAIEREEESR